MTTLFATIGDSFERLAAVKHENDQPYPLDHCILWFTVTPQFGEPDTNAVIKNYWEDGGGQSGIDVQIPELGQAIVSMTPEQTALLEQRAYRWDLQIDDAWGRVTTISHGILVARWSPTTRTTTP